MSQSRTVRSNEYDIMDAEGLSFIEQSLYRFLDTGPFAHYSGIFVAPAKMLMAYTGFDQGTLDEAMGRLQEVGRIRWDKATGVCWLPKCHTSMVSEKQVKGARSHVAALPGCDVVNEFIVHHQQLSLDTGLDRGIRTGLEPVLSESITDSESKKGECEGETKPRKRKRPADWQPNMAHAEKCEPFGLSVDTLAEDFRNHHDAKGSTFVDWNAAFHTWIRNHIKFNDCKPVARREIIRAPREGVGQ